MSVAPRTVPSKLRTHPARPGRPWPLGATFDGEGVNFAVFSAHAEAMELCLFSDDGRRERARLPICERDGDVWHVHVAGLTPGTVYGYRAHGPYAPEAGHRFNPNKLLLDPYARALSGRLKWSDALMGYRVGSSRADLSFDSRDSAFAMPKSVVTAPLHPANGHRPDVPLEQTVIYEAHVKGMTAGHPHVPPGLRGTFLGMSSEPVLDHLTKLGVTTVELMPVQAFLDDRFLVSRGLRNYWGYQTIGFFAPEPRYMSQGAVWEFQAMVRRFHAAGIEVILDVVYNHTGEGDELGPTLSFRGLDNRSYYLLKPDDERHYLNPTGTGNALNLSHPMVLRMVMDSLRYWAEICHVDGFRFDLATVLAREAGGFDVSGGFLDALRQDPVLGRLKLIAEPWDLGPGGYQLGSWPHPFLEWNDRFRDGVRRYWRGDAGMAPDLAKRLLGSAERFDHGHRAATSSVNFITAHDGYTLEDVVSYVARHNEANGEDNHDGHHENYSDNFGIEGPTEDSKIRAARDARKRAMLATLMLSQGTPMLLSGDEIGNSQRGNNNAYAQDNATGWIDWDNADQALCAFVARLIRLRKAHPVLRQRHFLHSRRRSGDDMPDLLWRRADGRTPTAADWDDPEWKTLCVEIRVASETPTPVLPEDAVFAIFNAGPAALVVLPELPARHHWRFLLDTTAPEAAEAPHRGANVSVPAGAVVVLARARDR
ncbi:glycogen debranching protein GlgX [Acidimangrovimonas pyrenivorans]|uniref:Glycogen debranching protein GlgX n=1 Tax=Acidimangrovimonas pyrenivorans TaxID=2030798 RepID=A0ABV7AE44_9RHOB